MVGTLFDGFDGLRSSDANDFIKRDQNLTYIEHLIKENTDLVRIQQVLTQFALLIKPDDHVHQLALEKFTRCVCLHLFKTQPLAELSKIKSKQETYFPFYVGNSEKPDWLKSYNADHKTPEMLQFMFTRESIRVKVGQCVSSSGFLANLDLVQIQKDITTMANDPFFSAHQTPVYQAINSVSTAGGNLMRQIPGLSYINTLANKMADATGQPLEVVTARKTILLSYADRILGILSDDLRHISQKQKLVHVELLSIFFASGNETLQNDIAEKATKIILLEKDNHELLRHFLKNIAPEPLGLQCFGLQAPKGMLPLLSLEANRILLASIEKSQSTTDSVAHLIWTKDSNETLEWLAYLMCMGNFPQLSEVRISFDTLTHRQTLLLLYLMGSSKLVIDAQDPVSIAKLSTISAFTPQCIYDLTSCIPAGARAVDVTKNALAYGRLTTHIRIKDPADETIATIMQETHCFHNALPGAQVNYSLYFSHSERIKSVEFQLSRTTIRPSGKTITNEHQREKLIGYILDFFSDNWKTTLMVCEHHQLTKNRPLAIPASALSDHELHEEVKEYINKHLHLQLFVYNQPDEGKHFLYDIHLLPTKPIMLKPGPFTLTDAALALAVHDFPELQMSTTQKNTLRLSQHQNATMSLNSDYKAVI
jgi:hypothetical protein